VAEIQTVTERRAVLRRRDGMPHFEVTTIDGERVRYADLWQHRNLVFVSVDSRDDPYGRSLAACADDFAAAETALVVSTEPIKGVPTPGVVVADQFGEIAYVFDANHPDESRRYDRRGTTPFPSERELLDWVNFVRMNCPECPP
jgi:hypothetical protein